MLKKPQKKKRNPDRSQTAARLTISWSCYDALDEVAISMDGSMSEAVQALIKFYEDNTDATNA